jgi:hypothetical protein
MLIALSFIASSVSAAWFYDAAPIVVPSLPLPKDIAHAIRAKAMLASTEAPGGHGVGRGAGEGGGNAAPDGHGVVEGGGNGAAPPRPIFNLGLQKSGTSSFADFVWRQLKLTTFHAHVHLLQSLGGVHESGCVSSGAQDKQYPDSSGWLSILNHTERLATVLRSRAIGAWGDTPVAFMLPLIEKVVPDAKYVLWPRASDS